MSVYHYIELEIERCYQYVLAQQEAERAQREYRAGNQNQSGLNAALRYRDSVKERLNWIMPNQTRQTSLYITLRRLVQPDWSDIAEAIPPTKGENDGR